MSSCTAFYESFNNSAVSWVGNLICQLEEYILGELSKTGVDATHMFFLVALVSVMLLIVQKYFVVGQDRIMGWVMWGLILFILFTFLGVI